MFCMWTLLIWWMSTLCQAGERGAAVGATVGLSLLGEAAGAPVGLLAYAAWLERHPPPCVDNPNPQACEGAGLRALVLGPPTGMALGGYAGAVGGAALVSNGPVRAVARNVGITAGLGGGLVLIAQVTDAGGLWLLGAPVVLIGVPVVAGVTAARAPDEARHRSGAHRVTLDDISPSVTQDSAMLTASGRF